LVIAFAMAKIWPDPEALRGERAACPPEAADHLVEDEQDAMLVADSPEPLQVTLGWHQHAGRAGDRLHEDGSDVLPAINGDDAREILGELGAVLGLASGEAVLSQPGVAHVHDAQQSWPEGLPVLD
jgi:hypothetical protein